MVLSHSIEINSTPDAVFSFFEDMEANYLRWHPDHIEFRWVSGHGLREGHVAHYAERIAGPPSVTAAAVPPEPTAPREFRRPPRRTPLRLRARLPHPASGESPGPTSCRVP